LLALGRLDEAEESLERAERTLRTDLEPAAGISMRWARAELELVRGRPTRALDAFRAVEGLAELLHTPHVDAESIAARTLHARVRLGHHATVHAAVTGMDQPLRHGTCMCNVIAELRLAERDPAGALVAIPDPGECAATPAGRIWLLEALLLEATAHDALGDTTAVHQAIERALDLAEPDGVLLPFLLRPVDQLLQRHSGERTSHASLVGEILDQLAGGSTGLPLGETGRSYERLSDCENRVLRYLPTNLSLREIADELYVSVHTIKTHTKHIYGKLNAHGRAEAVEQARTLGLLAPSLRTRDGAQVVAPVRSQAPASVTRSSLTSSGL
jgi:LuxR family maltose regulon positive regulatory protein